MPLSHLSGPELLIHTALAHPGQITLLCFGPLTNVAVALGQEPRLATALQGIFLMGGASRLFLPDWNVRSDARAARIVFAAGVPVTMIGWNVTWRCRLRKGEVEQLRHTSDEGCLLRSCQIAIWQLRPMLRSHRPSLHDPLVVAALCAPQLFCFERLRARILTRGPFVGFTIARFMEGPTVRAAMGVQCEQARAWMMSTVPTNDEQLRAEVSARYARTALQVLGAEQMTAADPCCAPTCCSATTAVPAESGTSLQVVEAEQAQTSACCGSRCCSTDTPDGSVITSDLYSQAELGTIPMGAALASLGCGNPTALAELKPGERVLDLGSGGGIDVLLMELEPQRTSKRGKGVSPLKKSLQRRDNFPRGSIC